jgi:hypothetical protein
VKEVEMKRIDRAAFLLTLAIGAMASAQSFNIDVGPEGSMPPPDTYAGAGRAGRWMSITAEHGVRVFSLVDVDGVTTSVSVVQVGGTETVLRSDPNVTGDDAMLMNDCVITHTPVENCIFFANLEPGAYEIIVYARMPNRPTIDTETDVDEEDGNPHYLVGGAWPGHHELLVSYALHRAVVTDGVLGFHAGVPSGGNFQAGAALNGFQVRRLTPGDATGDDIVSFDDVLAVLAAWGDCLPPPAPCPADLDGNGTVNFQDLLLVLANWS